MADRDILFRIGVASHPETQKRLTELGESVKRTTQQIEASIVSVGNTARQAANAINETNRRQNGGGVAVAAPPAPAPTNRISSPLGGGGGVTGDLGGARDRISGLREELQGLARDARGVGAAFDLDSIIREADTLRESIGGIDSEAEQVTASLQGISRESEQIARDGGKAFRELTGNVEGVATGIGQLAGGLALLGADSSNIKAFVEQLQYIKGGLDIFTGLTKTVSSVVQGYSLLTERGVAAARSQELLGERTRLTARQTELAGQRTQQLTTTGERLVRTLRQQAAAEEASASADRRRIRSGRELADQLERVIHQTERLDAAEDRLNANPPHRPAAGGIVAPGFRGRGRGGALLAGLGSILGYQAVSAVTDDPLASELGSFALNEGLDRGLSGVRGGSAARNAGQFVRGAGSRLGGLGRGAGRVLGGAAAAFSAVELGKLAYDSRTGTIDPESGSGQFFGGIGTNRSLANFDRAFQRNSPFGRENDYTRLADSYDAVDRAQKRADESRANREREDEQKRRLAEERNAFDPLRDFENANRKGRRASEVAGGRLSGVGAAQRNIADDARALQRATEAVADADERSTTDKKEYLATLQRAQSVAERLAESQRSGIAAIQEESSLRQAINRDSISAAEQRISLLDTESDRIRGIAKQAENQLLSGAQRFARLSDADQAKTIQAQQIANSGGQLTDKQRGLLDAIGTFSASDAARRADLAEAQQKGFYNVFGREERQLVGASDRSIAERDRRELGAAQSRFGSTVQDAQRDGRISLEERRGILAARSELDQLRERQQFARDGRQSERRSQLGFSAQEAVKGAQQLGTNESRAQQLQVTVANKQQFEIQLKTNEDAAVKAVQKVLNANVRGQEQRMQKILQSGLDQMRFELQQAKNQAAQQGKNARPT
ncbi:MAG: hypothetical protein IT422_03125 [Pirellulaceae bacterium]|nr:hypothetical protein [Pirellulaceae bacterium]